MLALGLVLMLAGAVALAMGLFTAGDQGDASLLGIHVGATAVFLVGLFSGVALLVGFSLTKLGAKRSLKHRKEKKQLVELSQRLGKAEAERQRDEGTPSA